MHKGSGDQEQGGVVQAYDGGWLGTGGNNTEQR